MPKAHLRDHNGPAVALSVVRAGGGAGGVGRGEGISCCWAQHARITGILHLSHHAISYNHLRLVLRYLQHKSTVVIYLTSAFTHADTV